MIELYNYLLSRGFEKTKNTALITYLTSDIYIKMAPQSGNWNDEGYLYVYIFEERFGLLMTDLFKDKHSLAWKYLPRKLRKDLDGCLGMVMAGVDLDTNVIGNSTLTSRNHRVSIESFLDKLETMKKEKEIFYDLYDGMLNKLLVLIEGMWVYLYFSKKLDFSVEKTLTDVEKHAVLKKHMKTWNLKRDMDAEVVEFFYKFYDNYS